MRISMPVLPFVQNDDGVCDEMEPEPFRNSLLAAWFFIAQLIFKFGSILVVAFVFQVASGLLFTAAYRAAWFTKCVSSFL